MDTGVDEKKNKKKSAKFWEKNIELKTKIGENSSYTNIKGMLFNILSK